MQLNEQNGRIERFGHFFMKNYRSKNPGRCDNSAFPLYLCSVTRAVYKFNFARALQTLVLFFASSLLYAQSDVKSEQEQRAKITDVPDPAKQWLQTNFPAITKMKWYVEQSSGKQSYEAKFKRNKRKFSAEFSSLGVFEDLEITLKFNDMSKQTRAQMESYLNSNYSKYKIVKVQAQVYDDIQGSLESIDKNNFDFVESYEMEFHGKNSEENELWEAQFNANGLMLNLRKIVQKSNDNLSY